MPAARREIQITCRPPTSRGSRPAARSGRRCRAELRRATHTARSSASCTPASSRARSGRSSSTACSIRSPGRRAWQRGGDAAVLHAAAQRYRRVGDAGAISSGCATRQATYVRVLGWRSGPLRVARRALADRWADRVRGPRAPVSCSSLDVPGPDRLLARHICYDSFGWSFFAEILAAVEAGDPPGDAGRPRIRRAPRTLARRRDHALPELRRGVPGSRLLGR